VIKDRITLKRLRAKIVRKTLPQGLNSQDRGDSESILREIKGKNRGFEE